MGPAKSTTTPAGPNAIAVDPASPYAHGDGAVNAPIR